MTTTTGKLYWIRAKSDHCRVVVQPIVVFVALKVALHHGYPNEKTPHLLTYTKTFYRCPVDQAKIFFISFD